VPDLEDALRAEAGDLLIAWNITLEGLTAAVSVEAERRRVPWMAVPILHLARPQFYTMAHQMAMLKEAQAVVALTPSERGFLLELGFDPRQVHVVSPGINLADGQGADGARFRAKHGITGHLVLTLAALCYDKGTSHLLAAGQRLWAEGRELTLALVGPQQRSAHRALARVSEAHRKHVLVLGEVSDREKWDALQAADVMALPSRTDSFGIVYLEAWALGKPVVGAQAGAVPDVIEDGEDGLLVPFGDVSELAGALRLLLDDSELSQRMGLRGRKKVTEMYQWDHQYRRIQQIAADVVADGNGR
jgi:glycosyltransferase involved in cell wall biosynthesis